MAKPENKISENRTDGKKSHKDFWKTNKKKIIIIVSILLFIVIIGFILLKLNFLVGEQLRMTIAPEYLETTTVSPGNISFDVDIKLYNKFVCDMSCKYSFIDLSDNSTLDNGTFNSKIYKDKKYSANIALSEHGYGTNLYLYRVECSNIPTTLCPSSDDPIVRKSLLVVSYKPSNEELAALFSSKESYSLISRSLANASILIKDSGDIISKVNLSFDTDRYYALKSDYDSLDSSLHKVLSLWDSQDFILVQSFISNNNLSQRAAALSANAASYKSYLNDTIAEHNNLLSEFWLVHNSIYYYDNILSLLSYDNSSSYITDETQRTASNSVRVWNNIVPAFNSGNYNQTLMYVDISNLRESTNNLNNVFINSTRDKLSDDYPALYVYSNALCMAYPDVTPGSSNVSAGIVINNSNVKTYLCSNDYSIDIPDVSSASFRLGNICDRSSVILDHLELIPSSASFPSGSISSNDSSEFLLLQYKLLLDYESMNNKDSVARNNYFNKYINNVLTLLASEYNISASDASSRILGHTFNMSDASLIYYNTNDAMLSDIRSMRESCGSVNSSNSSSTSTINTSSASHLSQLKTITVQYYSMPQDSNSFIPSYPINPPETKPRCCVYDKCQSCDNNSSKSLSSKNPLILLHGHSFNKANNAYESIEIFNRFEDALTNEEIYYPTGMLVYEENSTQGILGRYMVPIVSRPTYYIETYYDLLGLTVSESKTSNIDTYVLRLKESIDYTRYLSGKDKVDIVAHSMGGLVVRRYMQVFGTDHLGTVILIASPNDGISDQTYNLCKIFGASNECDDMRSDGLFIKKLNDLSNQPDMSNVYLVVGKGCNTDGKDGDGVVTLNNSVITFLPVNHILYVNGKCSGTTLLHNEMLNINEYPQVYNFVKSKLEQHNN